MIRFSPLEQSSGWQVQYVKDRENISLTSNEVKYIYKKVEKDNLVNVETHKQEIEEDTLDKYNEI